MDNPEVQEDWDDPADNPITAHKQFGRAIDQLMECIHDPEMGGGFFPTTIKFISDGNAWLVVAYDKNKHRYKYGAYISESGNIEIDGV